MSYTSLIQVLIDNGLDAYGNERGMASGIFAAYHHWESIEADCKMPTACGAIANTFINKEGYPSWLDC